MKPVTLITGASSGIGLELSRIAARHRRPLLLVAQDPIKLKQVQAELSSATSVYTLSLDLSLSTSPQAIFNYCQKHKLVVSELINDAGFGDHDSFAISNRRTQLTMIDLNVRCLTELCHLFIPGMVERGKGKVMNLGSVASFLPGPKMSVYYATKHYVLSFSESIAEELKGSGVTVTCLCPGPTESGFSAQANAEHTRAFMSNLASARDVAEFGWYAMQDGQRVAIYGTRNRLLLSLTRFVPRSLLSYFVKKYQS